MRKNRQENRSNRGASFLSSRAPKIPPKLAPFLFSPNKIIAIDPDIKKNGIAILNSDGNLEITSLDFFDTLDLLAQADVVVIEASWLNRHIFVPSQGRKVSMEISRRVGLNHAVGILLSQFAEKQNKKLFLIPPLKGARAKNDEESALSLLLYFLNNKNYVSQLMEFSNGRNPKI